MKQDCSKTIVFYKEAKRCCNSRGNQCVLEDRCALLDVCTDNFFDVDTEKITKVMLELQKWSDENPIKTRKEVFLEVFPNAKKFGVGGLCAGDVFTFEYNCFVKNKNKSNNGDTCEQCWNKPAE